VPSDEWGEEVIVAPAAGRVADDALAAELIAFCRDRLAHYMCPRSVDFVAELPRQDNGKIAKVRHRDTYRTTAG
jgi:fatty-acyl-CoA synthase